MKINHLSMQEIKEQQMKTSIQQELTAHVQDLINDETLNDENRDEWHHLAFNEDHYIIGWFNAKQWVQKHELCAFEVIDEVQKYELANFGETITAIYPENIVNMYVYILGLEIIQEMQEELDAA